MEKIRIEAVVHAKIDTVWSCWVAPEHITAWNFASDDWCCPNAEVELRPGGRYVARMEAKDGSMGFDFEAEYNEIEEAAYIKKTMPDGRLVETWFVEQGDAVKVVTEFDAESENSVELQKNGWQAILNNFKRYAEGTT